MRVTTLQTSGVRNNIYHSTTNTSRIVGEVSATGARCLWCALYPNLAQPFPCYVAHRHWYIGCLKVPVLNGLLDLSAGLVHCFGLGQRTRRILLAEHALASRPSARPPRSRFPR